MTLTQIFLVYEVNQRIADYDDDQVAAMGDGIGRGAREQEAGRARRRREASGRTGRKWICSGEKQVEDQQQTKRCQ